MLVHHKVTAPAFHQASLTIRRTHLYSWEERDSTHLYSWVERDTVKVNYFTQEHNRMTQLGLEPRPPRPGIHCTNHYATATKAPKKNNTFPESNIKAIDNVEFWP